jgi:uncharacterized membrane protein YeaQ/YmgE (transglycosylase-associated protein family)
MTFEVTVIIVPEFDLFLLLVAGVAGGLIAGSLDEDRGLGLFGDFATGVAGAVLGYYTFGYFGFGYGGSMMEVMLCALTGSIIFLLIAGVVREW